MTGLYSIIVAFIIVAFIMVAPIIVVLICIYFMYNKIPIECDECKGLFKEKENTINGVIVCPKCNYNFKKHNI